MNSLITRTKAQMEVAFGLLIKGFSQTKDYTSSILSHSGLVVVCFLIGLRLTSIELLDHQTRQVSALTGTQSLDSS